MAQNKITFGTGGFRAVIGEDFNKDSATKISQALSDIISQEGLKKKVCVGYDNRFMSEVFAKWCSEVFAANGVEVIFLSSSVPTPVVMYVSKKYDLDYSIAITASHNPYNYNGVKVFYKSADASVEVTSELEKEIESLLNVESMDFDSAVESGLIKQQSYTKDYLESIYSFLNVEKIRKSNIKIVFDAMYGSSIEALQMLIDDLNISDCEILNFHRDAFFGFALPAPTPQTTTKLVESVVNGGYDIGFAVDGDGDRLAVVDKNGNFIDNNYIMAMLYYYYLKVKGKKGDVVKNICTLNILDIIAEKYGYNCHQVDVGFKNVSSKMNETGALIGGESSGGLAMPGHVSGKDSIFAICLMIDMLCDMGQRVDEVLEEVKHFADDYNKVMLEKSYKYEESRKQEILDVLLVEKKLPTFAKQVKEVIHDRFVKVCFIDGTWTTIRFSGTEPILRIMAEINEGESEEDVCKPFLDMIGLN